MTATTADARAFWQTTATRPGWEDWPSRCWASRDQPHRDAIIEALRALPWRSLVEIGCGSGPNLARIAEAFPSADLVGLDVDQASLEAAREQVAALVIESDLTLDVYGADVVLSCGALCYVAPEALPFVLNRWRRAARVALVIVEPMVTTDEPEGPCAIGRPEWRHDYGTLLGVTPRPVPRHGAINAMVVACT